MNEYNPSKNSESQDLHRSPQQPKLELKRYQNYPRTPLLPLARTPQVVDLPAPIARTKAGEEVQIQNSLAVRQHRREAQKTSPTCQISRL
jgi:hypothetical protein